jgi:hypothetical protein
MPFEILEPIAAGIIVALLNKFIINYDYSKHHCCGSTPPDETETHHDEVSNSSSNATVFADTEHLHFIPHQ